MYVMLGHVLQYDVQDCDAICRVVSHSSVLPALCTFLVLTYEFSVKSKSRWRHNWRTAQVVNYNSVWPHNLATGFWPSSTAVVLGHSNYQIGPNRCKSDQIRDSILPKSGPFYKVQIEDRVRKIRYGHLVPVGTVTVNSSMRRWSLNQ